MARRRRPSPAQLIRRISRPAPPSELPCGSLSRPSPKVSIRFGLLRQPTAQPPCCLVPSQRPLARDLRFATVASFAPAHVALWAACGRLPSQRPLARDLRFATVASFAPAHVALWAACGRLPSQRPLARVQVSSFRFPVSAPPPPRSPRLRVSPLLVALHVDSFAPAQLALRANLRLLYLASAPTLDSLFVISVSPWLINRPSLTPISKASATRVFVRFHRLRLHLRGSGSGHR